MLLITMPTGKKPDQLLGGGWTVKIQDYQKANQNTNIQLQREGSHTVRIEVLDNHRENTKWLNTG